MKFTLDTTTIKTIALAESVTHAQIRDCVMLGDVMVFIVDEGEIGMAIGKGHSNVRRLEMLLKRRVKIIAYSEDVVQFIRNLMYPLEIEKKEEKEGILYITGKDVQTRAMLIGRNATTLRAIEEIVKRYFQIQEIRVVQ
ncbi:NusA-like transcription termination signal-binding factor [Candidatus Woesearchaeota archaeon]|nr:NusA-like transcription termination signal-binding factor [Candidatus Woesearchaeota archaeon]